MTASDRSSIGRLPGSVGDVDGELRSLAGRAVDGDGAAESLGDEVVDDVEAEARAALRAAGSEERFEHVLEAFVADAPSVIAVVEPDAAVVNVARHPATATDNPGVAVEHRVQDPARQ